MKKDFLVITAFMDSGNTFRRRNLIESVHRTHNIFPDADIVVSEQGNGEWVASESLPCIHLFEDFEGPFRKTRLLNRAVRENPGYKAYVMVDADVLLSEKVVEYIRGHYLDASLVYPYGDCIYLTEPDTMRTIANRPLLPGVKDHGIVQARQTGLCNVFTWDTFEKIGGYDDSFVGWGAEDDAFLVKCKRLVGPISRNADPEACVNHMFHPKINTLDYVEHNPMYVDNRVRCACIRRMTDEDMASYIAAEVTLEALVAKYKRLGRLDISIDWQYTPLFKVHMDATIYDIDRNGEMSMTKILDAMCEEDGPKSTIDFLDDIKVKVKDLNEAQMVELETARKRYAAAIRA